MKRLTEDELTHLIQNTDDLTYAIELVNGELSIDVMILNHDEENEEAVPYYINRFKGFVRYYSKAGGIEINFGFLAEASSFEYPGAYKFNIFIDFVESNTFEVSGFVLVDKNGCKLKRNLAENALADIFLGRDWESGVRRLLPTLSDQGEEC